VIRQVFKSVSQPGFRHAKFGETRLKGRTWYPRLLAFTVSNSEKAEDQMLRSERLAVTTESKPVGNLLRKPGLALLTPGQYQLLGARIIVLLEKLSKLPFMPIQLATPNKDTLDDQIRLEVKYGLTLMGYMLETARGFYDNVVSLEGPINPTAMLLVEFWWWLHTRPDYLLRENSDQKHSSRLVA
jgi:hypothetical protein